MVEELQQYVPVVAALLQFIAASDDYSRSTAMRILWYKDTGMGTADSPSSTPTANSYLPPMLVMGPTQLGRGLGTI